ncbi:MAG: (2Fe-2S)-binding protein [Pseudomonadota bacterium]
MIICSCARISSTDIRRAVEWMRASDPQSVVTPGKLYRALGKQPDCGGCIRLLVTEMRGALGATARDLSLQIAEMEKISNSGAARAGLGSDLPMELRGLRGDAGRTAGHEGRRESHRISKQGAAQ